jgi:hypothetical protein
MVSMCPVEGEWYYLGILLHHIRGATSFDDLKTTSTAVTYFHDFSPNISSCVWWYITKTLYGVCLVISICIVVEV